MEDKLDRQMNLIAALTLAAEFPDSNSAASDNNFISQSTQYWHLKTALHRTIRFFIERCIGQQERSSIITKVFQQEEDALILPVDILQTEEYARETKKIDMILSDEDYRNLSRLCVNRIEGCQNQGTLIRHKGERDIRDAWIKFGEKTRIQDMLKIDFSKYPAVMHALLPFANYSGPLGELVYTISLDLLEQYTSAATVLQLLKEQADLSPEEAGIRSCLAFAIKAKASGEPYSHEAQLLKVYNKRF